MNQVEMVMPKMGESIMEGTILKWLKNEGDSIDEDESVLEVATDKVDTEIPSTFHKRQQRPYWPACLSHHTQHRKTLPVLEEGTVVQSRRP